MSAIMIEADATLGAAYPHQVDMRWETENRPVWNEQKHAREECELVYEISWIPELGAWRKFLRPGRRSAKLQ